MLGVGKINIPEGWLLTTGVTAAFEVGGRAVKSDVDELEAYLCPEPFLL